MPSLATEEESARTLGALVVDVKYRDVSGRYFDGRFLWVFDSQLILNAVEASANIGAYGREPAIDAGDSVIHCYLGAERGSGAGLLATTGFLT